MNGHRTGWVILVVPTMIPMAYATSAACNLLLTVQRDSKLSSFQNLHKCISVDKHDLGSRPKSK